MSIVLHVLILLAVVAPTLWRARAAFLRFRAAQRAAEWGAPKPDPEAAVEDPPSEVEAPHRGWGQTRDAWLSMGLVVLGLLLWSPGFVDADFPLLDAFKTLGLIVAVVFVLAGFVPRAAVRRGLNALVVGVVLVVLLGELHAELDFSAHADRIEQSDDRLLRYQYRSGVAVNRGDAVTNSRGLNDDEYVVPKPDGVYRIVVLGDSVPNDGIYRRAEMFDALLERQLEARVGEFPGIEHVEVVNVSCEGFSTLQEVRLFERRARDYDPDLVVVAYVLNDPFLQNGGSRRQGNSVLAHSLLGLSGGGSVLGRLEEMHGGYAFDLMVRSPLERLALLAELDDFEVMVAVLPIFAAFEDHPLGPTYERVAGVASEQGFATLVLFDALSAHTVEEVGKPRDITHPTPLGHSIVASELEQRVVAGYLARP